MEQYSIYEGHMEDLLKKFTRIRNKCMKFGCEFHFEQVGEEIHEVKVDEYIHPITRKKVPVIEARKFFIVEAEGTAKLNDWEFIASVEHTEKGNIFSKAMTDVEIPERYRTMNPVCEHCNSNRTRKNTFIVHNTVTGEFKMVGHSCLADFTNGLSVSTATWFASMKEIFKEYEELPICEGGWNSKRYYKTSEVMKYIAETIRHFGFVKSKDSEGINNPESTKAKFHVLMRVHKGISRMDSKELFKYIDLIEQVGFNPESSEATAMVKNAMTWIEGSEANSDYIHNLKVATSLEYVDESKFGLLVSLFPAYNREAEAEEGKKSEWVGHVGDRIEVKIASVKCVTSWESSFGYHSTMTYVWKITDASGNVFTWKTSTWMNEESAPKTIKGTVKEHKEFREVKQTELTRCKIA